MSARRWFRIFLILYPPSFRERNERDMLMAFRDGWDENVRSGMPSWRYGLTIARDFIVTLPRAWWTTIRPRRRTPSASRTERQVMHNLLKDIRYALRGFRRKPGFAIIAVTALGLGIGLTTAMFSIVNGVVLRGLPVEEPHEIMAINRVNPSEGASRLISRVHDYVDLAERQTTFDGLAAMWLASANVNPADGDPEFVSSAQVTANAFQLIGTAPFLGRGLIAEDEVVGGPAVVVVGFRFWQDRLGGDPAVVGNTIRVDGQAATLVGVMPEGYEFPVNQQIWQPLRVNTLDIERGGGPPILMLGRLKDGVSLTQAQGDLGRIMTQLGSEYPDTNEGMSVVVGPYARELIGFQISSLLFTMLGAVGLVLLIACANVANLLLARASLRSKEVAVRTAMGASRRRVIVQLLVESSMIAAMGALIGVGVAQYGISLFNGVLQTLPQGLPFWFAIGIDPKVLVFVLGLTIAASLLSGMLPAIRASGAGVNAVLKDESRGSSSLRMGKLSRGLVVLEVALSCTLLVAAGLLVKSVTNLSNIDYAFATENIFTTAISLPEADYPDDASRVRFFDDLMQRVRGEPGVEAVSVGTELPVIGFGNGRFGLEGETYLGDRDYPSARLGSISPSYFETLDAQMLEGRSFTQFDNVEGTPVVIVNQSFVDRHYPNESALGKRIQLRGTLLAGVSRERDDAWYTVVGVAPNMYLDLDAFILPVETIYAPLAQRPSSAANLVVRVQGDPLDFTTAARRVTAEIDADIPLSQVASLDGAIGSSQIFFKVFGVMFTIFGAVALFLATIGLYGVLSFSVNQRKHEVGLRVALGASPNQVVRLMMRQGLGQLGIGMAVGGVLSFGLARLLSLVLYDVGAADPMVFGGIAVVLVATGFLASFIPARRATRVDPTIAMRAE